MSGSTETITLAAIGDLHVDDHDERRYRDLFAEMGDRADVVALAGDLTNFGKVREAEILAEDVRACSAPVVAVLGNHDYECGCEGEVARILHDAGVTVLDEQATVVKGVGFAGVKGYIGGFGRAELGAFGEAGVKAIVDEAIAEARKLENALRTLRTDRVVALLHYAPVADTVQGEPPEIFPFLGSQRLADAVDRFDNVRLVLHGHAHRGAWEGRTPRGTPVHNVAQFVCSAVSDKPYALFQV